MYIDSNTTSEEVFKKMIESLYFLAEHSDPDTTDKTFLIEQYLGETPAIFPLVRLDQCIQTMKILIQNANTSNLASILQLMDGINLLGDALEYYKTDEIKTFPELELSQEESVTCDDMNEFLQIHKAYIQKVIDQMEYRMNNLNNSDISDCYHMQKYLFNSMTALDIVYNSCSN